MPNIRILQASRYAAEEHSPSHFQTPPPGVLKFLNDCFLTSLIIVSKDVTITAQRIKETVSPFKIRFVSEIEPSYRLSEELVNVVPLYSKCAVSFLNEAETTLEKTIVITREPRSEIEAYLAEEHNFYQDYEIVEETVTWSDLSEEFQSKIFNREVKFQHQVLPLRNLLVSIGNCSVNESDFFEVMLQLDDALLIELMKQNDMPIPTVFPVTVPPKPACYIERNLIQMHEQSIGNEKNIVDPLKESEFLETCGRVVCIAGPSGIGKSTILLSLAEKIMASYPSRFVLFINMKHASTSLSSHKGSASLEKQILYYIRNSICENGLGKFLMEKCLADDQSAEIKVEIMIDELDESALEHADNKPSHFHLEILKGLSAQFASSTRIFVTTGMLGDFAINKPEIGDFKTYCLSPLNETDQVNLLTRFWKVGMSINLSSYDEISKLQQFAKLCLQKINRQIATMGKPITTMISTDMPLLTWVISEIYRDVARNVIKTKGIPINDSVEDLCSFTNLAMMYSCLVETKFQHYYTQELANPESKNRSHESIRSRMNLIHYKLALQSTFPSWMKLEELRERFNLAEKGVEIEEIISHGHVCAPLQNVQGNPSEHLSFTHHTVAEYFLAKFFLEFFADSTDCNCSENYNLRASLVIQLLITDVLSPRKYADLKHFFLCQFLNDGLQNPMLDEVFENNNFIKLEILNQLQLLPIKGDMVSTLIRFDFFPIVRLLFEAMDKEMLDVILAQSAGILFAVAVEHASLPMIQYLYYIISKWSADQMYLQKTFSIQQLEKDNRRQISPLHCAAGRGDFLIFQYLVNCAGFTSDIWRHLQENHPCQRTILHEVVDCGGESRNDEIEDRQLIIDLITKLDPSMSNACNVSGHPLLFTSTIPVELFKTLIMCGADPSVKRSDYLNNGSLLHHISRKKDLDPAAYQQLLEFLISYGLSLNDKDEKGLPPLAYAVERIELNKEIVSIFQRKMTGFAQCINEIFLAAIEILDVAAVEKIICRVEDVIRSRDHKGNTVCHHVLGVQCLDDGDRVFILQKLLERGADINAVNYDGQTPTQFAIIRRTETIKLFPVLEDFGALIYTEDMLELLFTSDNFYLDWNDKVECWLEYLIEKLGVASLERKTSGGTTLLHHAAFHGSLNGVKCLIETWNLKTLLNSIDHKGNTPLHYAATVQNDANRDAVIFYLLETGGVNTTTVNFAQQTPLLHGIAHGVINLPTVMVLLPEKCEGDNSIGKQVLQAVFQSCDNYPESRWTELMDVVYHILYEGYYDLYDFCSGGKTCADLVHTGASKLFLEGIKYILGNSFCKNPNVKNVFGNSLLHTVLGATGPAQLKNQIVEYLISQGANVNGVNADNQTPLVHALESGFPMGCATILALFTLTSTETFGKNEDLLKKLLFSTVSKVNTSPSCPTSTDDPNSIDAWVTLRDEESSFAILLRRIEKIGLTPISGCIDQNGATMLHHAIQNCHLSRVQHLVETYNFDLTAVDKAGNGPTHYVFHLDPEDQLEILKYLIKSGADVQAPNNAGMNPLQYAFLEGKGMTLETLKYCLEHYNQRDSVNDPFDQRFSNDPRTVLHGAVKGTHKDSLMIVKHILENYCRSDINERDVDGNMPLHHVVDSPSQHMVPMVEYLIRNGGRVDAPNTVGNTPLLHLLECFHLKLRQLSNPMLSPGEEYEVLKAIDCLIDHGADVSRTYHHSEETVLHKAAKIGLVRVVRYLLHNAKVKALNISMDSVKDLAKGSILVENRDAILKIVNQY